MLWLGLALACLGLAMVLKAALMLAKCTGRHCLPDVKSEFCLGDAGCGKTVAQAVSPRLVARWHCYWRYAAILGAGYGWADAGDSLKNNATFVAR